MSMSLAGVLNPGVASPGKGVFIDDVGSLDPTLFAIIESGRGVYLKGTEVIEVTESGRAVYLKGT